MPWAGRLGGGPGRPIPQQPIIRLARVINRLGNLEPFVPEVPALGERPPRHGTSEIGTGEYQGGMDPPKRS